TKPWNDDEVLAVVSHAVDRFWLMRENDLLKQELELKDAELRKFKKEAGRPKVPKADRPGGAAGPVPAPPTSA
ncbi:MAG TPA: hypothetical protein PK362_00855, partial [Elusimicrobiota bacterium]|nr:hypothetical protein [Elusimicrobiota bacterium]